MDNSKKFGHGMFLMPFLNSASQKKYLGDISELQHLLNQLHSSKGEFEMALLCREMLLK